MRENRPSGSEGGAILIQSSLPLSIISSFGTKPFLRPVHKIDSASESAFEDEDDDEDWDENTNWARGPSSPSSRYSCQNIRHPCLQFLNVRSSPIGLAAAGTFREIVIVQAGQRF